MSSLIRNWLFQVPFKHTNQVFEFENVHLLKHLNTLKMVSLRKADRLAGLLRYGRPISQVLRSHPFLNLNLHINRKVLIPRTETEYLVHELIRAIKKYRSDSGKLYILDVGTGSGCIGLALAANLPNVHVDMVDFSPYSQICAESNAFSHAKLMDNLGSSFKFIKLNYLQHNIYAKYDIIVSNPPYIPSWRRSTVQKSVLEHEPHSSLFVRPNFDGSGLAFHRKIMDNARALLKCSKYRGPKIAMEFESPYQAKRLSRLATMFGFLKYMFVSDQFKVKRFLFIY